MVGREISWRSIDRVVEKNPQVAGTQELPCNEQRAFGEAASLFSGSITPKEGRGSFCRLPMRAMRMIARPELHACIEFRGARPDRNPSKFSRATPASLHRAIASPERWAARRSRNDQLPRRMWNLIQNRATRSLLCHQCDDIFSATNFIAHFNAAHDPCAAKVLRAAPQCRCDQPTLSVRGSDESSASR